MSKTIGRKVCGLVIICGVIMAFMCIANIAAFKVMVIMLTDWKRV